MPGRSYRCRASVCGCHFHSLLRPAAQASHVAGGLPEMRVHSVFRRVVNIRFEDCFLSLVSPGTGNATTFLTVDLPENYDFHSLGVERGMPVSQKHGWLEIDGVLAVDCRNPSLWKGRPPPDLSWNKRDLSYENLATLRGAIDRWGARDSLARAINRGDHQLAKRFDYLAGGLRGSRDDLLELAMAGILGYGAGLTPGGDDMILGLLAAAGNGAGYRVQLPGLYRAVTLNLDRTTEMSASFLRQAIAGNYHEYVQEVIHAVVRGMTANVTAATRVLLGVGATSGTEIAEGIYLGFYWQCNPEAGWRDSMQQQER